MESTVDIEASKGNSTGGRKERWKIVRIFLIKNPRKIFTHIGHCFEWKMKFGLGFSFCNTMFRTYIIYIRQRNLYKTKYTEIVSLLETKSARREEHSLLIHHSVYKTLWTISFINNDVKYQ